MPKMRGACSVSWLGRSTATTLRFGWVRSGSMGLHSLPYSSLPSDGRRMAWSRSMRRGDGVGAHLLPLVLANVAAKKRECAALSSQTFFQMGTAREGVVGEDLRRATSPV